MSLHDLNISGKLGLGFAGVVTVVTAMCFGLFVNLHSIRIAKVQNGDEVAQLNMAHDVEVPAIGRKAEAVESFKLAAIEKIRLQGEAADQQRQIETDRKAAEAERAAAAQQQSDVVGGLAQGLERLAAGVLTFRLTEAFSPSCEKLRADFNSAMERMQQTISEVATNSAGVRTASISDLPS